MKCLIIECSAVATRACFMDDETPLRFWFGPARGDEAFDTQPLAGRHFAARVKRTNKSLGAAFVDIGDGEDGFLPLKKDRAALPDGAMITVTIKSPPRQGKGAQVRQLPEPVDRQEPGRIEPMEDASLEAIHALGADADEIIIDDGAARANLLKAGIETPVIHEQHAHMLWRAHHIDDAFAAAFERAVPLVHGGRLVIDEAEALTAIDVDTGGLEAASLRRLREKICHAAMNEAVNQIRVRNIGGHVVIDFPSIKETAPREKFRKILGGMVRGKLEASAVSFSKSGLFTFTLPRRGLSLLDRFTEAGADNPIPGRRFKLSYMLSHSFLSLEANLRQFPSRHYGLSLGEELFAAAQGLRATERLQNKYGARFEIVKNDDLQPREYRLDER